MPAPVRCRKAPSIHLCITPERHDQITQLRAQGYLLTIEKKCKLQLPYSSCPAGVSSKDKKYTYSISNQVLKRKGLNPFLIKSLDVVNCHSGSDCN